MIILCERRVHIKKNMKDNTKPQISYLILSVLVAIVLLVFTVLNFMEIPDNPEISGLNELSSIQNDAVTIWGGLQKIMGKNIAYGADEYKDVTTMVNGYYTLADMNRLYEPAVECAIEASELAKELGAQFLYIQSTGKVLDSSYNYPGVIDYATMKRDAVVSELSNAGIQVIDSKEILQNSDREWMDYFYVSDHHWNNYAAFEIYKEICKKLEDYGYEIDEEYLNQDNYSKEVYEDIFLGSHGRMAGPLYTGLDDYELWLPNFDTDYSINIPSIDYSQNGSFEECFVHYENLAQYSYDYYAYYAYLKEDYKLIEITNNNKINGPRVLIIRDSSAVPVSVFLSTQCSSISMMDLRYLDYDESILDYITDYDPDVIMYIFGAGYLGDYSAVRIR